MKNLTILPQIPSSSVPAVDLEKATIKVCREAALAEKDLALKAVIAGMHLLEFRASQKCLSHGETGKTNEVIRNNQYSETTLTAWFEANKISRASAYRWMDLAERVARGRVGLSAAAPFSPVIDVEGVVVPMSQVLTAPEGDLPDKALEFRQGVFTFMQDKTLREAAMSALAGESPGHRYTRALAGKTKGGTRGEDRKAWPTFIAEKLSDVSGHLSHWKQFSTGQKEQTEEAFKRAIEKWPTPLLEALAKGLKTELQKR
jgi:hypothetical protein